MVLLRQPTPDIIIHFESFFIPYLVREYSSGNISLETLTDTPMMQIFVLLNDEYKEFLPVIEQTKISVETDKDQTVILYIFPKLDTIIAARYGTIVLSPDKSPKYYTLERTFKGQLALCRNTVCRHTLIRFLSGQTSAKEFVSLVKNISSI